MPEIVPCHWEPLWRKLRHVLLLLLRMLLWMVVLVLVLVWLLMLVTHSTHERARKALPIVDKFNFWEETLRLRIRVHLVGVRERRKVDLHG